LRWSDVDLNGDLPTLTVSGTIKTETGKGTYRKSTPKSDASRRTVVLPRFAAELLRVRRQIRKDTGFEWVTPHTFRKTVATLVSEATTSELASRQLGHSSSQVTRDHYIAKPPVSADLRGPGEARPRRQTDAGVVAANLFTTSKRPF
jgi:integrase